MPKGKSTILDKVKALMASSRQKDSQAEATAALKMARHLMGKHGITPAQVAMAEIKEESRQVGRHQKVPYDLNSIARTICTLFQVDMVWGGDVVRRPSGTWTRETTAIFVGHDTNVEIAGYVFDVLLNKYKSARKKYRASLKNSGMTNSQINTAVRNYASGWCYGIRQAVQEVAPPKIEVEVPSEKGLIKVDPLAEYLHQKYDLRTRRSPRSMSGNGASDGIAAGKKVKINRGMAGGRNSGFLNSGK